MIRDIVEVNTENKVWEIVNRGRKGRRKVNQGIEKEQWREYFMGLLGGRGVEARVRMGAGEGEREREEDEISKEEVRRVIRRIKEGKARGGDEIPSEAWKWGGKKAVQIA